MFNSTDKDKEMLSNQKFRFYSGNELHSYINWKQYAVISLP